MLVSQSVSLPMCMVLREGRPTNEKWKKKVLSISAAWAGSWWKQGGGRLAGRSHALFRHHSDGAQPLGQNTAWFLGTLTRATLEKPRASIRTSPSYSNCSPLTILGAAFCRVHSKLAGDAAVSLPIETDDKRPLAQFSFGTRSAKMWNTLPIFGDRKKKKNFAWLEIPSHWITSGLVVKFCEFWRNGSKFKRV